MDSSSPVPTGALVKDLSGTKIIRWTILKKVEPKAGYVRYLCRCECGAEKVVKSRDLLNGKSQSCGCLRVIHGMSGCREHNIWMDMIERTERKTHKLYHYYGARGIIVSPEWRRSFLEFYKDMGPSPTKKHSIDRKNNDGNYCKENCRWATTGEQALNRRNNVRITHNGETMTMMEWSRKLGLKYFTIRNRLKHGWGFERAISTPEGRKKPPVTDLVKGASIT